MTPPIVAGMLARRRALFPPPRRAPHCAPASASRRRPNICWKPPPSSSWPAFCRLGLLRRPQPRRPWRALLGVLTPGALLAWRRALFLGPVVLGAATTTALLRLVWTQP
ncbi:hypothetical protein ACU686_11115 [Yinghuangia aomiensis]